MMILPKRDPERLAALCNALVEEIHAFTYRTQGLDLWGLD